MASGLAPPAERPEGSLPAPPAAREAFIDDRLQRTRRQVKLVDLATAVMTLVVGVLVYLFVAVMLDHWVLPGGLGLAGRCLVLLGLLGGGGFYFVRHVVPPLVYRINPIFAAQTIEQSWPTLKNSLINFLLVRNHRGEMAPVVYRALEQRAAADLSDVKIETAVDRVHVIHLAWLLTAVAVVFGAYLIFSPKSPLISTGRILWPFADLAAPTRVTIGDVRPGDTIAFFGDAVPITAEITGLRDGEQATLLYATADARAVDQAVPLTPIGEGHRFQGSLPPGTLGLQQSLIYKIVAGDCRTRPFHIEAQVAPAIVVARVDYHYPPYTGMVDRSAKGQGDLRAIEGTRVTIHAEANHAIRQAEIDLNCAGLRGLKMDSDGKKAVGQFTLAMSDDDRTRPRYDSYQLLFSNTAGQTNRRPVRYRIEVQPDLPPELKIVEPREEEAQVGEDGQLQIGVHAEDDFGLRRVVLHATHEGRELTIAPLLEKAAPDKAQQGAWQGTYEFRPKQLKLKAGDHVAYWAEAEDNKEPTPNRVETAKRVIHVVAGDQSSGPGEQPHRAPRGGQQPGDDKSGADDATKPDNQQAPEPEEPRKSSSQKPQQGKQNKSQAQENQDQQGGDQQDSAGGEQGSQSGEGGKQSGDKGSQGDKSGQKSGGQGDKSGGQSGQSGSQGDKSGGQSGQSGSQGDKSGGQSGQSGSQGDKSGANSDQSSGQSGDQPQEKIDPKTDAGDAMQKILDHKNKEDAANKQSDQKQGDQGKPGDDNSGDKAGGDKAGGDKAGGDKAGGDKAGGDKAGGDKAGGDKAGGDKAGGDKAGGDKAGGDKAGGDKAGGDKAGGDKAGGDKANGDKAGGDTANGDKAGGDKANGDKAGGDKAGGDKAGGDKANGDKANGDKANGDKSNGDKANGDKANGDKPNGDKPNGGKPDGDQSSGPGDKKGSGGPSPAPQGDDQPRQQDPGRSGEGPKPSDDPGKSPSTSPHQSSNEGQSAGDRSGHGKSGGGQGSQDPGKGVPGSHSADDQGGSKSNEQGSGETGNKSGDQVKAPDHQGSTQQAKGDGSGQRGNNQQAADKNKPDDKTADSHKEQSGKQPGGTGSASDASSDAHSSSEPKGARPDNQTSQQPGAQGSGNPTSGNAQGSMTPGAAPPAEASHGEDPNMEYARKQTALALEHLKDQMAKDKPGLLKELGWNRDEAQRFLNEWSQWERDAAQHNAQGQAARKSLDEAIRSLGLRPRGTELKGGHGPKDRMQQLRDAGRSDPPADWDELYHAYSSGVAGGGK